MEIAIDKLIYGGDGLGRMPADENGRGKAVFVPFVLAGERVSVELKEERPGFARASLDRVLEPSKFRTVPPCPYFGQCGGCHYQHTSYEHQLEIKKTILQETLQRTAKLTLDKPLQVHAGEPWQYRNRTRMKVQTAPDFAIGYFKYGSHELLAIEECPISSPLINRAVEIVWEAGRDGGVPTTVREVQFFADHEDKHLLLEFYIERGSDPESLREFAEKVRRGLPAIVGAAVFEAVRGADEDSERAPLISSRSGPGKVFGDGSLTYQVAGRNYRVSAGAFFQTNRFVADELVHVAIGEAKGGTALDLYAGTGLFTLPLAESFDRVIAVEAAPYSFGDLKKNAPRNVKPVQATTERYVTHTGNKAKLDLIVADPPRSGLGEKVARALGRMSVPRVTYVSCDPSTLSRDLRVLLEFGFRVEEAHLVDLFPQTFHMESVFHLVR